MTEMVGCTFSLCWSLWSPESHGVFPEHFWCYIFSGKLREMNSYIFMVGLPLKGLWPKNLLHRWKNNAGHFFANADAFWSILKKLAKNVWNQKVLLCQFQQLRPRVAFVQTHILASRVHQQQPALFAAQVQVFLIQHSMHCGRGDPSRIPLHRRPSSSLASSICERQENESNFSLQSPLSDKLGQKCASWAHPQIQNLKNLR